MASSGSIRIGLESFDLPFLADKLGGNFRLYGVELLEARNLDI